MPATRIHHLNFLVRDLTEATGRFEQVLDVGPFEILEHASRGARVARTRIGESWLVLVAPYDNESVPGRHLSRFGEGLFLLSVGYDDAEAQLERLPKSSDEPTDRRLRDGIAGWRVADIGELYGTIAQLTDDSTGVDE
jgi:methylmalonyl-CoA/ethylmalonyl-CoA epimerase